MEHVGSANTLWCSVAFGAWFRVSHARAQVASLVGADPKEIIFTSGATESNNMSIKGVANFYKDKKRHIITTQTERARPRADLTTGSSASELRAACLYRTLALRPRADARRLFSA